MPIFSLLQSIPDQPAPSSWDARSSTFATLTVEAERTSDSTLLNMIKHLEKDENGQWLMFTLFTHSPFLSRLVLKHLPFLHNLLRDGVDETRQRLFSDVIIPPQRFDNKEALMRHLREFKSQAALLAAIADITRLWSVTEVTAFLSQFAEVSLNLVCDFLLFEGASKGEIVLGDEDMPSHHSGLIVLGMGKLGGNELNYSSDIDLIILFDAERVHYTGSRTMQHFFSTLAQDLVKIMQERTAHGYVFRTDLRLRPDPASMPAAISMRAALSYYETLGQNWERAAMIKARPVAGDYIAAEGFLREVRPFMWRKYLDFSAIADIQSIKRQMDSRVNAEISLPGHHVKLGLGGIREIEFFVQVHQLIWGGKLPELRTRGTLESLHALYEKSIIEAETFALLTDAYLLLRRVEHYLQMIDDQQTHTIPDDPEEIEQLGQFLGYETLEAFETILLDTMREVHAVYVQSFKQQDTLGTESGALVFTGVEADPGTISTLSQMGYTNPHAVSDIIQAWHRGKARAMRTKRARELLTEITPSLLQAFAGSAKPDVAFLHFNQFISKLPSGIQLFSLFVNNPGLMKLIVEIMGTAPALSETLSRNPMLLDSILTKGYSETIHDHDSLVLALEHTSHFEERLQVLRHYKQEREFQIGISLLQHKLNAKESGRHMTTLAEKLVRRLLVSVEEEFTEDYGSIEGGSFAMVALGKLGSRELTFGSDLDVVFVYDAPEAAVSDGKREVTSGVYYNRLAQRFLGVVTAPGKAGRLYEMDTRLKPSGSDTAVSFTRLQSYLESEAWTFELMAMTRARTIAGDIPLQKRIEQIIQGALTHKRSPQALANDVYAMRERIEVQFATRNPWNVKYARGGLIDIDFIAQYHLLLHMHEYPELLAPATGDVLQGLVSYDILANEPLEQLLAALTLQTDILNLLRLCSEVPVDTLRDRDMPHGLCELLTKVSGKKDFKAVKEALVENQKRALTLYEEMVESVAFAS